MILGLPGYVDNIQYDIIIHYTCILVTSKENSELEVYSCEFDSHVYSCTLISDSAVSLVLQVLYIIRAIISCTKYYMSDDLMEEIPKQPPGMCQKNPVK